MRNLRDKVVLITGGTSGIGLACSEHLAALGAKVVAMSVQADAGKALARRLTKKGLACRFFHGDVTREKDVKSAIAFAAKSKAVDNRPIPKGCIP